MGAAEAGATDGNAMSGRRELPDAGGAEEVCALQIVNETNKLATTQPTQCLEVTSARVFCSKRERGPESSLIVVKSKSCEGAIIFSVEIIRANRPKSSDGEVN
jgi:hypothetical protein